jgi:hypothetical protein
MPSHDLGPGYRFRLAEAGAQSCGADGTLDDVGDAPIGGPRSAMTPPLVIARNFP